MITFQAIPLGIENEGALRPPGLAFFRAADLVKYGIGTLAAGIAGSLAIAPMSRVAPIGGLIISRPMATCSARPCRRRTAERVPDRPGRPRRPSRFPISRALGTTHV
jgi:hypothetical protein